MRPTSPFAAAILSLALVMIAPTARAERFEATIVAGHPRVFLWVQTLSEAFIPAADAALAGTGHSIAWTEAYGGTLARIGGTLEAMEDGLAEIGIVSSLFEPSLLSLQNVTYATPFGSPDVDTVLRAIDAMHDEIPDMRKLWEEHDLEYLGVGLGIDDYFLMTKEPVRSLADLKGRKIGAPGPAVNWLKGTGAVGVSGNLTTYYNDLQTGVIDGVIAFATGAAPAKLYEQAKYVTRVHFGAQYAGAIVARKSWFDGLPEPVRAAVRTGAAAVAKAFRKKIDQRIAVALAQMTDAGVVFSDFPEAEREAWAKALPNLPMRWARDLDGKGLAGTAVVRTYLAKLRAAGTRLPRDWVGEE